MPGRYIKVRKMKEQELDGDLRLLLQRCKSLAPATSKPWIPKETDGSNVHLGGPDTITGYFGGVGQPNHYPLKWLDEFLYYYTNYGVNRYEYKPGTVLVGYLLYSGWALISNSRSRCSWATTTRMQDCGRSSAKLFSRDDGSSPLIGFIEQLGQ